MRDINRIEGICNKISEIWKNYCPDWRFMQLMNNFMGWLGHDGFYIEDDKFIERFNEYIKELFGER